MIKEEPWSHSTQKFPKASYPDRSISELSLRHQQESPVLLRSKSDSELNKFHPAFSLLNQKGVKHIQIKKEDHTLRTILCIVLLVMLTFLLIDVRSVIQKDIYLLELEAKECHSFYIENECETPVQALRQKCKEYYACFMTPPAHNLKVTKIMRDLLGGAADSLTKSAGLTGTAFILLLLCAVLCFTYKSSKEEIIVKKH